MSMLAEPRRRQKWSLNPRGTDWANDDNKFGQKLMEKMGWSKGKGLGREEQGMKEHISLRFKDNSKGLGYKGNDDEWVKHYEGFEDVLATLNSEHNSAANSKNGSSCNSFANSDEDIDQKNKKSLEARSKVSKARVHYHKFTRGKDLSRYNKDDIACILGSKRAKKLAEAYAYEDSTIEVDEIGHVENLNGVTTIKGCTMQDYFAQKMGALKKNLAKRPQNMETDNYTGEAQEPRARFGFGFDSGIEDEENATTTAVNNDERSTEESTKKMKRQGEKVKKRKKKEKNLDQLDDVREQESLKNGMTFERYNELEESKEGTRKKEREQVKSEVDQQNDEVLENCISYDTVFSECNKESKKSKKKKKIKETKKTITLINNDDGSILPDVENTSEMLKKNKQKAKSSTEEIHQNVNSNDIVEGLEQNNDQEKKKRKRRKEDLEYAEEEIGSFRNKKRLSKANTNKHLHEDYTSSTDAEGILSGLQLEKKKQRNKDKKHKKKGNKDKKHKKKGNKDKKHKIGFE